MRLDQILADLSQTEGAKVLEAIEIDVTATARALTRRGYPISEAAIRRWKAKREHSA